MAETKYNLSQETSPPGVMLAVSEIDDRWGNKILSPNHNSVEAHRRLQYELTKIIGGYAEAEWGRLRAENKKLKAEILATLQPGRR